MRRFGGGHSVALGFLLALALERHMLVFALLIFAAGLLTGRAWATWTIWASALREKWHLSRAERIETRPVPVYGRPRRSSQDDPAPLLGERD